MKKFKLLIISGILVTVLCYGVLSTKASQNQKIVKSLSALDNKEISIKLSELKTYNNKKYEVFKDNNQNQYIYSNNDLVGFYKDKNSATNQSASEKVTFTPEKKKVMKANYQDIATNIVENIINKEKTNMSNYELTDSYFQESYNEFTYTYTKLIDGYHTTDSITVSLDVNGELSSFSAPRQGIFNKYENIKINKNDVNDFIKEEIEKNVSGNTNEDTFVNYAVENKILNIINDKPILKIYIALNYENHIESTILSYDKI